MSRDTPRVEIWTYFPSMAYASIKDAPGEARCTSIARSERGLKRLAREYEQRSRDYTESHGNCAARVVQYRCFAADGRTITLVDPFWAWHWALDPDRTEQIWRDIEAEYVNAEYQRRSRGQFPGE